MSVPIPHEEELVLILSVAKFPVNRDATVCCARGVGWWSLNSPILCKLPNRSEAPIVVLQGHLLARIAAVNTHHS